MVKSSNIILQCYVNLTEAVKKYQTTRLLLLLLLQLVMTKLEEESDKDENWLRQLGDWEKTWMRWWTAVEESRRIKNDELTRIGEGQYTTINHNNDDIWAMTAITNDKMTDEQTNKQTNSERKTNGYCYYYYYYSEHNNQPNERTNKQTMNDNWRSTNKFRTKDKRVLLLILLWRMSWTSLI